MLALECVSASYGNGDVIGGISIDVAPGEVGVILGPNGAGKTSTLRAIMGFLQITGGIIRGPDGAMLRGMPPHQIARLGVAYVPEGRGILNSLTARENLLVGASARRLTGTQTANRIDTVLETFPALRERLGHSAGLLSGGQQQMLAIGRALMASPRVLLLDEPSLGLAPLVRREISELLLSIKSARNLSVLLVEQDIRLAQRCADFAHVLRRGRLSARFDTSELADRAALRDAYLGRGAPTGDGRSSGGSVGGQTTATPQSGLFATAAGKTGR